MKGKTCLTPENGTIDVEKLRRKSDRIDEDRRNEIASYIERLQAKQNDLAQLTINKISRAVEETNGRSVNIYYHAHCEIECIVGNLKYGVTIKQIELALSIIVRSCQNMGFNVNEIEKTDGVYVEIYW